MFSSYPRNVFIPSRIRSHPSQEMLFSRPGYALIPARKCSSPVPERFRPTKINFANIGKIPDSISLIDPETDFRFAIIRIFQPPGSATRRSHCQFPGSATCRSHCQFPGSATCRSHCQHCLRAIHLGRDTTPQLSTLAIPCLDAAKLGSSRQATWLTYNPNGIDLPR